nr:diaminopimelate dehydrogenase [Clostridia bacterium]
MSIRIAITGYGNIGRGVEKAIEQNPDMELVAVFTRRDPSSLKIASNAPVIHADEAEAWRDKVDVMIICGGSATDLPVLGPKYAAMFNTVDSFDTHAKIPEYIKAVDEAAKTGGHAAVISAGWDPGMFSLMRLYGEAALPVGNSYTFWGRGVSQGHSDAVRRIEGVKGAVQYTVPVEAAVDAVRSGSNPVLTTREKHTRVCYVVAEEGADKAEIERKIKTMPNYFDEYDTTVNFITEEELKRDHSGMPHGGFVIRSGETASGKKHVVEYSLKLESNPEFTSSILVACARACFTMHNEGTSG